MYCNGSSLLCTYILYCMSLHSFRDKWASDRETFFSTGKNKASLSVIETALFVLVFEDEDNNLTLPENVDNDKMTVYCKDLLCGQGWTRYFDKSFCLVCYPSSYLGINTEHSWYALIRVPLVTLFSIHSLTGLMHPLWVTYWSIVQKGKSELDMMKMAIVWDPRMIIYPSLKSWTGI